MKTTKKTLTFALVLAALLCLLVLSAGAYDGTQYGSTGMYYKISNGEVTITDAKSDIKTADIPESIDGYPVTSIGNFAFNGCTGLTKINWNAENVKDFSDCNGVFSNAGTSGNGIDVVFSDNVKHIPSYLFFSFEYKPPKIKAITIGSNVTSIGSCALDGTAWYNSQPYGDVYAGKVYYKYKGTMLANTKVTIKDGTNGIAGFAFNDCTGLISVTIPDSVTSIGGYAFYDCTGLTSITIPDSVTSIGSDVFGLCSSLKGVYISDLAAWCNIEFKGSISTFSYKLYLKGNPITNLVVPDDVISISDYAFSRCSGITSITIPDSVTSIGNCAFSSCPLTTLKIGKGLKSIGKNAFNGIKVIPELYYAGSEEEWKGISIDSSNDLILRANMHYNADLSHTCSYTETVTKKATCTEDGVKTFTCNCGRTYTETIQATGHKYVTETHKATCTSIGVSIKKCKSCGIVVSATTTPVKGHSTKTSALLTATETESGILVTSCETCGIITDASLINRIESVSLSKTSYTYNGKTQKPKVVVKTSKGKLLTEGKDYTVKYPKGMKNPGTYTVTVTFKGSYSGKKTLTFTIAPKAPTLKVKAGAKKATLSWNKQTGSSGYVVYMATSKNGKYKKLATVKGGSKTSYTAAKLTKGKTVYFKVVSYTASGKTTVRSAYSKPVGAKIK